MKTDCDYVPFAIHEEYQREVKLAQMSETWLCWMILKMYQFISALVLEEQ
jgi:hypothetical protein